MDRSTPVTFWRPRRLRIESPGPSRPRAQVLLPSVERVGPSSCFVSLLLQIPLPLPVQSEHSPAADDQNGQRGSAAAQPLAGQALQRSPRGVRRWRFYQLRNGLSLPSLLASGSPPQYYST